MNLEFLLIEYQRLQQLHFTEKKDEEQRVKFFITIVSSAIAGVILLFQSNKFHPDYIIFITEVVLFLLFIIGFNTLGRIAMATVQSFEIVKLRNKIIEILAKNNDDVTVYKNTRVENISISKKKSHSKFLRETTTFSFLVIAFNTFIIGGFIFVPFIHFGKNLYCDSLLTATLIIFPTVLLLWFTLTKYYVILKKKLKPWESTF